MRSIYIVCLMGWRVPQSRQNCLTSGLYRFLGGIEEAERILRAQNEVLYAEERSSMLCASRIAGFSAESEVLRRLSNACFALSVSPARTAISRNP